MDKRRMQLTLSSCPHIFDQAVMSESLGLSQSPRPHQNSDVKSGRNTLTGSSCGREPESHAQLIGRQREVGRGPGQPEGCSSGVPYRASHDSTPKTTIVKVTVLRSYSADVTQNTSYKFRQHREASFINAARRNNWAAVFFVRSVPAAKRPDSTEQSEA